MLSFSALLLVIWGGVFALTVYSSLHQGTLEVARDLRGTAQELLTGAIELADRPQAIRRIVAAIERQSEELYRESGGFTGRNRIQVWNGGALVYGDPGLPSQRPQHPGPGAFVAADQVDWVTFTALDGEQGMAVRAAIEHPRAVIMRPSNLAYLLLPLVLCLPFLLLPAWLLTRAALKPLHILSGDIAGRDDSRLQALPPERYRYRELLPIVRSVNQLMARLEARLAREQAFFNDAAHELKTPLAVIQANAEALAGQLPPPRQEQARHGLRAGIERAVHAIHQLLALGRTGTDQAAPVFERTGLAAFTRQRMAFHAPRALERDIELEFEVDDEGEVLLEIETAAAMLDNLLDNAIKYSTAHAPVRVRQYRLAGRLCMSIRDHGPGIPAAFRERVFERFFRMPGIEASGSGLGLAIVEQAARRNGIGVTLGAPPDGPGLLVILAFAEAKPHAA